MAPNTNNTEVRASEQLVAHQAAGDAASVSDQTFSQDIFGGGSVGPSQSLSQYTFVGSVGLSQAESTDPRGDERLLTSEPNADVQRNRNAHQQ